MIAHPRPRHLIILLMPLAAVLGLSGCGSDSGSGTSAPAGDTTSPVVGSATANTPTPPTYEGGSAVVSVTATDNVAVTAVTLVDPVTSAVVPLTKTAGVWKRTVALPGNGSTTGTARSVSLAVTVKDAAGNSASAPVAVSVPAVPLPPTMP